MRRVDLRVPFVIQPAAFPGSRWLAGVALLVVLLAFFWSLGAFSDPRAGRWAFGPTIFFSAIIAYLLPVFGYISERTAAALDEVEARLDAEPARIGRWQQRIHHKPLGWLVVVLGIGAAGGLVHNLMLHGAFRPLGDVAVDPRQMWAVVVGTGLVWLVVTFVVAALLDNALVLHRAARVARVNLFAPRQLRPFAVVAVISTSAIIGAQALFPLLFIDENVSPVAYIPGLLATAVPMVLMAALPVWPVHRRMLGEKRRVLEVLERRIVTLGNPDPAQTDTAAALTPLLAYRREVLQAPEWPFDVSVVARLLLYLIIPPLTWVGAALIENVVESFL